MTRFEDHFSSVAAAYASFRPGYPAELFDWLTAVAPRRELVWDCACGSGQASRPLAERFAVVVASDASADQVAAAPATPGVHYLVAPAAPAPLASEAVDLVVVAQAFHWFAGEPFFGEVRRVLRPGGVLAVWTYALPHFVSHAAEQCVHRFIDETLGAYWPAEVRHVLAGYATLELPLAEISVPAFEMRADWTLDRFLAFVRTWSGVRRFVEAHQHDPVEGLAAALEPIFRALGGAQTIRWQVKLRAARK